MFDEKALKKVIGKLMVQVEEEKRRRVEAIQALTNLPLFQPFSIKVPTEAEIEQRIEELSQV
jgi:hypothetical protein